MPPPSPPCADRSTAALLRNCNKGFPDQTPLPLGWMITNVPGRFVRPYGTDGKCSFFIEALFQLVIITQDLSLHQVLAV